MTRRAAILACLIALASASPFAVAAGPPGGDVFDANTMGFLTKVDSSGLGLLGSQHRGRIAILDTVAAEQLDQAYGDDSIDGIGAAAAYIELYFRAGAYVDKPVIYIRERNMRAYLASRLPAGRVEQFKRTHRIAPAGLLDDQAWMLLFRAGRADRKDYVRAAALGSLRDSLAELSERKEFRVPIDRLSARYSSFLGEGVMRLAPGAADDWMTAEDVFGASAATTAPAPAETPAGQWRALRQAWLARDAVAVNKAIARLETLLPQAVGDRASYPSATVRSLERLYNRTWQFTVLRIGFAASLLLLIVAAAATGGWARRLGIGVFSLSTLILLAGFVVRWILSGRAWYLPPIMNQFEAVIGSALLGAVIALIMEMIWRQNFFALAAAFYATVALLAGLIFPEQMSGDIRAQHGILASPVMAIHVSVIIIGHALVGMTFVLSVVYLVGYPITALIAKTDKRSSPPDLRRGGEMSVLSVIDRCNLIVAQIACWSVVAGTILGAYWGDFAWGRWWGWDPKESWALITAMVYVALLHIRFLTPTRWRGLVTALICILGFAAMMFNWIVVNFILSGKHSYA